MQPSFSTTANWLTGDEPALSFRYPPGWRVSHFAVVFSFTNLVLLLGNADVHDPCFIRTPNHYACGTAVDRLQSGQVLVSVTQEGYPEWALSSVEGEPLSVDGLAAKSHEGPGCDITRADRQLEVIAARNEANGNFYRLAACFSGSPAVIQLNEAKFRHVIDSVRFKRR